VVVGVGVRWGAIVRGEGSVRVGEDLSAARCQDTHTQPYKHLHTHLHTRLQPHPNPQTATHRASKPHIANADTGTAPYVDSSDPKFPAPPFSEPPPLLPPLLPAASPVARIASGPANTIGWARPRGSMPVASSMSGIIWGWGEVVRGVGG